LTNVTAVKSGGGTIGQSIELVLGTTDWYRCSLVINVTSSGNLLIKPLNSSNQDVTGTMYIQDAMINQGLAAYPYIETTTAPVAGGILEDMPRLDYSNGSCPALLLEPQRTNIVSSMLFPSLNSATYILSSTKIGDGMPMQHFTKTAFGQYAGHILNNQSISSGDVIAFSMFFKPISAQNNFHKIQMSIQDQDSPIYYDYSRDGFFNDVSGTPLPSNKYVEEYANGVYRIVHIQTSTASATRINLNIDAYYNTTSQFLCGYAQVEQDATYPTSYIPTYGVSQTRLRDAQAELTTPNGNVSEGTIFYEFDKAQAPTSYDIVPFKVGTNRILRISQYNPNMRFSINENATSYNESNSYNSHIKVAVSYSSSSVKLFINGVLRATDTTYSASGNVIIPANGLQATNIGCSLESKQLTYFPTALTDSECIELTTI